MSLAWSDIGAITAGLSGVAAILFWALIGKLGKSFVAQPDFDDVVTRLKAVELLMDQAPSHDDFKAVNANVAGVALQMATMTERVEGVKGSLARIEGTLRMFVDARMQWEKESK